PFPGALTLGFFADADPDAPDPVAGEELEAAAWFDRDAVLAGLAASDAPEGSSPPRLAFSPRVSIARALIEAWAHGR
ncbi:MAG: NADH pyrophosphatase, partial [Lysobacteraceae bacterium]